MPIDDADDRVVDDDAIFICGVTENLATREGAREHARHSSIARGAVRLWAKASASARARAWCLGRCPLDVVLQARDVVVLALIPLIVLVFVERDVEPCSLGNASGARSARGHSRGAPPARARA